MNKVLLCACGCGEPALYAAKHVHKSSRLRIEPSECVIESMGYKTPCWIFKPERVGRYNVIRIQGRAINAHRAMYEQEVGPIPEGFVIDHLCGTPKCVRPDHLEAVTTQENNQRGRLAKLTVEQVREIRSLQGTRSSLQLSTDYGVSYSLICMIWRRAIWKNV